jgi:hypothetical protein
MRMISKVLLLAFLAIVVSCQSGCVFFRKEYVTGVDPDAESFAFVDEVWGNTLFLRDGPSVPLSSLSTAGMSEYQRGRLAKTFTKMAPHPPELHTKGKAYLGLLVRDSEESEEVLLSLPYIGYRRGGYPRISLFPIRIEVPPVHVDVIEYIIKTGMAKLDGEAISDPARRKRYSQAESFAKTFKLGVWASPGEQLLDAIEAGDTGEIKRLLKLGASAQYVGRKSPPQAEPGPPSRQHPAHHPQLNNLWWMLGYRYPGRTPLMVLCDTGGVKSFKFCCVMGLDRPPACITPLSATARPKTNGWI